MRRWRQTTIRVLLLASGLGAACSHPNRIPRKHGGVDTKGSPDEVLQVALVEGTAYGLTVSGRVRAWDVTGGKMRTLDREDVHQLAFDGSVAVSVTKPRAPGTTLEVWELATERRLARRSFDLGAALTDVSRSLVLLQLLNPPPDPSEYRRQVLPERSHAALWDLTRDQVVDEGRWPVTCLGESAQLSSDGTRVLCASSTGGPLVIDRVIGHTVWPPPLAPEWEPPPPPRRTSDGDGEDGADEDAGHDPWMARRRCPKCAPPAPSTYVISSLMAPDGATVYLTYNGMDEHKEWRLERWAVGAGPADPGRLERLASVPRHIYDQVLTVSHAGTTVVTGGRRKPLTVRRAPRFEAEELPISSANAAAFSVDDGRLLTGHEDGRLILWDARTLRQIAAIPQATSTK